MKILVFGDIHEHIDKIAWIDGISNASCLIISGDLTNVGGIERAKRIIDYIKLYNPVIYAQAGNFDKKEVETFLREEGISLHGNGFMEEHIGIFGVGGSNKTPFGTPNELDEKEIAFFITQGYEKVKDAPLKLFICHAPPFNTPLDMVTNGQHVGSKAVRSFIEDYQPDLCVTGHIHEGKGEFRIGRTLILNPGPLKNGGYVEIISDTNSIQGTLKG